MKTSKKSSHTRGPWSIRGAHWGCKHDRHFHAEWIEPNICKMVSSRAPDEVAANARLIAAAPELLSALQAVFRQTCTLRTLPDDNCKRVMAEAIAKAEGETK